MADAFFANPDVSVRGRERAVDVQARIVVAVHAVAAAENGAGDILVAAHGAVGAFLRGQLAEAPISRALDPDAWGLLTPDWRVLPAG
jgi:broad specificity phosphatase PhoE